ncbi:hypothetical protein Angca_007604 [Angiostrongylus cantonensis]|nr:hypothetical protein Angca_007604 [Angiostrongylus cantonensis]
MRTLFARKDLFKGVNKTSKKFEIFGKDCHEGALSIFESVYFDLAPVEEHYCMCLTNREIMNYACRLDLSEGDRSLTQFMEIVFNQLAIMNPKEHVIFENGKTFLCHPWLYGFNEKDCPEVGDGKRLFPGTQKSVHFIEGQRGRGFVCPALVIDAKKAAFHEDLKLIDKAKIILNDDLSKRVSEVALERLNFGMKGLFFYTRHTGHERDHQIAGIVNHTAIDTSFEMHDGVKVSVLQYFKEKYKICLEYPHAPLVKVREGGRVNNYPMELGFIRAMQRVTVSQQTPAQTHKTTKNCAIPPGERQDNIKKGAHALKLFGSDGNPFVTSAGLHISKDPMRIIGRCLPPPNIRYSENTAVVHNGKWRSTQEHFFIPARCEIWAMYGIVLPNESGRYSEQLLRDFGRVFFEEASRRGMKLTPPTDIAVTTVERDLENCLKNAALHHCRYCLIVSADSISTHKKMKLWERELEMVTQDVKLSTVIKVVKERRKVTVENIVLKANMKLGGLNYVFDFNGVAPRENQQKQAMYAQALSLMARVYIGSISFEVREEMIKKAFEVYGPIKSINMSWDPTTGHHKGFAFLEFDVPEAALLAQESMNGQLMGGRNLKVGRPSNMPQAQPIIEMVQQDAKKYHRVYVSSVHPDLSETDLKSVFEAFGEVVKCQLARQCASGKGSHRGFGYIEFNNAAAMNEAIAGMNMFDLGGQFLRVGRCITPPEALTYLSPQTQTALPTAAAQAAAAVTAKVMAAEASGVGKTNQNSGSNSPRPMSPAAVTPTVITAPKIASTVVPNPSLTPPSLTIPPPPVAVAKPQIYNPPTSQIPPVSYIPQDYGVPPPPVNGFAPVAPPVHVPPVPPPVGNRGFGGFAHPLAPVPGIPPPAVPPPPQIPSVMAPPPPPASKPPVPPPKGERTFEEKMERILERTKAKQEAKLSLPATFGCTKYGVGTDRR